MLPMAAIEIRAGGRPRALADAKRPRLQRMSTIRAGILVTGNEVLSAAIADRNGPWLRATRERGVELAHIIVVADRPDDLRGALEFLRGARASDS